MVEAYLVEKDDVQRHGRPSDEGLWRFFCKVSNGVLKAGFGRRKDGHGGSDKTVSAVLPVKVIRTYACHCVCFESSFQVKG